MMEVKTTTIRIPSDTLIKIKSLAVKKGTTQNNIINDLINRGLKNTEQNKGKIRAKLINEKLPKPKNKAKKYENLKDMAGIIKLDHETDSVKLKNSIYTDKAGF
jgi:predicted DNA-binding protein